jgi:hypothetical protein
MMRAKYHGCLLSFMVIAVNDFQRAWVLMMGCQRPQDLTKITMYQFLHYRIWSLNRVDVLHGACQHRHFLLPQKNNKQPLDAKNVL